MTKTKWTTCSSCSRAAGLTLIEVVAAIAILGTILAGIVLAKSRHTAQLYDAQRRSDAVAAADALLYQWWTRPEGVPVDQSGVIESTPALAWRTRLIMVEPIKNLGARVVRVELFDATVNQGQLAMDDAMTIVVDLVLPDPVVEEAERKEREERESEIAEQGSEVVEDGR
jgi:Tfp pilus assembly protein PilE